MHSHHAQTIKKDAVNWENMSDQEKMDFIDNPDRPQALTNTRAAEQNRKHWFRLYKHHSKVVPAELANERPHTDFDAP